MEESPPRCFRDLLQLKADGYEVDDWQFHVWRTEEEFLRATFAYGTVFHQCGLTAGHFESPIHRLCWSSYEALCIEQPDAEVFPPSVILRKMRELDPKEVIVQGNLGLAWIRSVLFEEPLPLLYAIQGPVKDLKDIHNNRAWAATFDEVKAMQRSGDAPAAIRNLYTHTASKLLVERAAEDVHAETTGSFKWSPSDKHLIQTGIEKLDAFSGGGIGLGEMMAVGAGTNVGKSYFAELLCSHQAEMQRSALHISLEDPSELFKCRVMGRYSSYVDRPIAPSDFRLNAVDTQVLDEIRAVIKKRHGDRLHFVCNKKASLLDVCQLIRMFRYAADVRFVVVDYLQAIDGGAKHGDNRVFEMGRIISTLKKTAGECGVALVVLSQLTRESYKQGAEPHLNSFKYCGDIENEAEIVVLLWQAGTGKDEHVRARIAKVKWKKVRYDDCQFRVHVDEVTGSHLNWDSIEEEEKKK